MTLSEAMQRLSDMGVLLPEPQIPTPVVTALVEASSRAGTRAASTAYSVGNKAVPALANGRIYQAIQGGSSGSALPVWPTVTGRGQRVGQRVVDGTVIWIDIGAAHPDIYDVNAAARSCWLWRASQLTTKTDISDGQLSIKRSQLYDHAIAQARRYGWRGAL